MRARAADTRALMSVGELAMDEPRQRSSASTSVVAKKPSRLDEPFCAGDASLRAKDFAERCFREEAIWRR